MVINGFSNYEVVDDGKEMFVFNRKTRRLLKNYRVHRGFDFSIIDDAGIQRAVSIGFLRYLAKRPALNAVHVNPAKLKICFDSDGNPMDMQLGNHGRTFACFSDVDEAVTTVMVMLEAGRGNFRPAFDFIDKNKNRAISSAARIFKLPVRKIERVWSQTVDDFIDKLSTARMREIKPLRVMLVNCIRNRYLKYYYDSKKTTRIKNEQSIEDLHFPADYGA